MKMRKKQNLKKWLATVILLIIAVFLLFFPLYWSIIGSFKTPSEIFSLKLPSLWKFSNYPEAWRTGNWSRYFFNSFFTSGIIALGQTFFGALAGYSLAKFRYPGKNVFFATTIATLPLSQQVIFLPLFLIVSNLGWIDSYIGLIVPILVTPFSIFLMRQYMLGISDSLIEAARLDGASEPRIFFRIILPLSKPVLIVVFILGFSGFYNNLLWPLVIIRSDKLQTISLALQQFKGTNFYRPDLILAATIMSLIPISVLFFFLQRFFMQGVSISVEKE